MKKALAGLVAAAALVNPTLAGAETLHVACGSMGMERDICTQGAEAWAKKTGHTVQILSMSTDVSQELATLQQLRGEARIEPTRVFRLRVGAPLAEAAPDRVGADHLSQR